MIDITYRAATIHDAEAISDLILNSQRQFCFHEFSADGQQLMLRICSTKAIKKFIERGDVYFIALHIGTIVGVAGIRDNKHLEHNFVAAEWHRRGISKHLWSLAHQECIRRGNTGSFNLLASTYAIPVYERWGFVRTGPTSQDFGITSTPMELRAPE